MTLLTAASSLSPRSLALLNSLAAAGHEVTVSRLQRTRLGRDRLFESVDWTESGPQPIGPPRRGHPEVIHAATSRIVVEADRAARNLDAWVARRPDWPAPSRDWIAVVPDRPELSIPVGRPPPERRPWASHGGTPSPERHHGRSVVLCFRPTPASPAHHLQAALERAGVNVHITDIVDYRNLPPAEMVVVVESPTPPIIFEGDNPGIPVVFWIHHGEHHLEGNLRLAKAYGADLVLLAHSWHLAARFDRPVQRFPFAADTPEGGPPFAERRWNLAFVGSESGSAYDRRRSLLDQARRHLTDTRIVSGVPPVEVPAIYRQSRSVLNEGGNRHLPITMRVFEALGSGALLVTDPAPGLDLLFDGCYLPLGPEGLDPERLERMLSDGTGEAMAREGHRRIRELHTYDHRVDLLFRLAEGTDHEHERVTPAPSPLGRFLGRHPYGQRMLDLTGTVSAPDREVWRTEHLSDEPADATFDTVVMGRDSPAAYARAARRYVIGTNLDPDGLPVRPRSVSRIDDLVVIDVGGAGYDVETVGGSPPPTN